MDAIRGRGGGGGRRAAPALHANRPSLLADPTSTPHTTYGSLDSFRPLDDILDEVKAKVLHLKADATDHENVVSANDLIHFFSLGCTKKAMRHVCEVKDISPEITVYRYSFVRLLEYLKTKVARLHDPKTFDISRTMIRNLAKDGLMEDGKEELLEAGRRKAACELLSQYLPKDTFAELLASYDFVALDAYHNELKQQYASAAAATMSAVEAKESKSGASEGAKKRKVAAKGSHGVEKLKKANTKGMAKLSSFFQKPA
ncbi:hypothetical protein EIP91_011740 [Steccherinum ochraceum]|uniref:Ribonuclease H2 subunit B wHTH domain-containing protein n=1 Tax=Steccherinum ochraceum TaxID=92696 RepID=A0A4R0RVJ5_9APHY|nr:hypothetical protein EIP91_011740 [Steccherinum ochraceum]